MAILIQSEPEKPRDGWIFWVCVAVLIAFVVVVLLARLLG